MAASRRGHGTEGETSKVPSICRKMRTHTHLQTYIQTYKHTHILTYKHTCIHIPTSLK